MSTHFYFYRVERRGFWGFVEQVRDFYFPEGPLMLVARDMKEKLDARKDEDSPEEQADAFLEGIGFFREGSRAAARLTVELQVFEEDAEHYIFRVLEWGYTFMNHHQRERWPVEPVFFDDGTDLSPEEERLRPLVDRVEAMIDLRRYFITPVTALDDASMHLSGVDESPAGRLRRVRERYGEHVLAEASR